MREKQGNRDDSVRELLNLRPAEETIVVIPEQSAQRHGHSWTSAVGRAVTIGYCAYVLLFSGTTAKVIALARANATGGGCGGRFGVTCPECCPARITLIAAPIM